MSMFIRGGRPQHINATATAAGTQQEWNIKAGPTVSLIINNNHGSTVLRVYLTDEARLADEGLDINPGFGHEFPAEVTRFWTYTAVAGSFQAIALCRP